jgi:alpha-tubulin suppressor-like RCC1 family protein
VGGVAVLLALLSCVGDNPGSSDSPNDGGTGADASDTGTGAAPSNDTGPSGCTDASDTSSDNQNCGACGHVCPGSFACTKSKCGNEVEEVAAGDAFSCVVLHEGSVYCWGSNNEGGLGIEPSVADNVCGSLKCRGTPQKIPGLANVAHVQIGGTHACALDTAGAVKCWGGNNYSQLAQSNSITHSATPIAVAFGAAISVAQISIGQDVTCVRTTGKDVYCWGADDQGVAGAVATATPVATPTLITVFNHDVSDIRVSMDAGSGAHACAIREPGTLWCWGTTTYGEGGRSPGSDNGCAGGCSSIPIQVGSVSGVTQLSVGPASSCAIVGINVQCWGAEFYGALGFLNSNGTPTPTTVTGLPTNTITTLVQGAYSEFGLTAVGDVWSWGALDDGSLADGLTTGDSCGTLKCRTNGAVAQLTMLKDVAQLSFKYKAGLALKKDGSVVAWGQNEYAQLGHLPNAAGAGDQTCGADVCHPLPTPVALP